MSDYTLYQGDCLEIMPTLAKECVAMAFCDVPYGVTGARWDVHIPLPALWSALNWVRMPKAPAIMTAIQPFTSALLLSNAKQFRHDLIWSRKRTTGFMRAKKAPLKAHEHVLVFASGDTRIYNPQMVPGKRNTTTTKTQRGSIFNNPKTVALGKHVSDKRYPRSLLHVEESDLRYDHLNGRKGGRLHPTQKPVALLEWLIATYTNPGDLVLDPCFGSCTTGVACARLERKFIGIEKDPAYFAAGKARLEAEHARLAAQPAQGALGI